MDEVTPRAPQARTRTRTRFSLIWLIPIVALGLAGYLGYRTLADRGPLITITFQTGDGLTAGQTAVRHKAVQLGTVESIRLSKDMQQVIVRVRMTRQADPILTNHARFWVVRPRLSSGSISGLETLVSGSYIEVDPGTPGGTSQYQFTGLNEPPGVRSDEPGRTFDLRASRIGSLGAGSPVFYRDVQVGEVLGYDTPDIGNPITVHIFVRAPFDDYVRRDTHFWNVSGLSVNLGPGGLHVEVASIQAVLSGGVAFLTPPNTQGDPVSAANTTFTLYRDYQTAQAAGLQDNIPFVAYFQDSVSGLAPGAPVQLYGIQVGEVTDVKLQIDPKTAKAHVRVAFEVQPQRIFAPNEIPKVDALQFTTSMVKQGMRAQLDTSNYLTGQLVLGLDYTPDAPPAEPSREGGAIVVPSRSGGLQNIASSLTDIVTKLNNLPLEDIANNLDDTVRSVKQAVSGAELKQALQSVSATMTDVQELVRNADRGMTPVLRRLPEISAQLEAAVAHANQALGSVSNGYGPDSDFNRNAARALGQVSDAARSIRLLADFLDRHPEALIRGRTGEAISP
jgi:paraquat-inducible protein B